MRTNRALVSLAIGAIVGLTVASLVGIPQLVGPWSVPALVSNAFTFWGLVFGGFSAVIAAGLSFALLNKRNLKARRLGKILAGGALAIFSIGAVMFGTPYGFPSPFTLEGLWFYPMVVGSVFGSVLLLRRRRPGLWDEPPAS